MREPIAVLGVGVEGWVTIEYLIEAGASDITALDLKEIQDLPDGVKSVCGDGYDRNLGRFATIFRSPGVRPDIAGLVEARAFGSLVTSATTRFLEECPAPVVGITGTVGKGTACSLTAAMLKEAGFRVHLGGNIGLCALDLLKRVEPSDRVVLEVSSFQAIDLPLSPDIAVVLRTTCEHMDWHTGIDEYWAAKAKLVAHQDSGDLVVFNADSEGSLSIASSSRARKLAFSLTEELEQGLFLRNETFVLKRDGEENLLPIDIGKIRLKGRFNLENVAAALLASFETGASSGAASRSGERFKGLPHRLELVVQAGGLSFVNDSYATRPDATIAALSDFENEKLAIILGGSEKNADFQELAAVLARHTGVVHVGLIGDTAKRIGRAIDDSGDHRFSVAEYPNMDRAVEGSVSALKGNGTVLLSPACASFGLFPNYKVRGELFTAKAREMCEKLATLGR